MRIKHNHVPKNLYVCPENQDKWAYIRYKAELIGGKPNNQEILHAALEALELIMKTKKKWDFVFIKKVGVL